MVICLRDYIRKKRMRALLEETHKFEDDYERSNLLQDYHNAERDWVEQWADKEYVPLGVELEVYADDRLAARCRTGHLAGS